MSREGKWVSRGEAASAGVIPERVRRNLWTEMALRCLLLSPEACYQEAWRAQARGVLTEWGS